MKRAWQVSVAVMLLGAGMVGADSIFSFGPSTLGYWAKAGSAREMGMGGANYAVTDESNVALGNPAAITGHLRTTWSLAGLFESRDVVDAAGFSQTFNDDTPRFFRIVFPVGFGAKFAVGISPLSDLSFRWGTNRVRDDVAVRESVWAEGGIWMGTFNIGRAFGPLRLGVQAGVVRGRLDTEWRLSTASPVFENAQIPLFGTGTAPTFQSALYSYTRSQASSPGLSASYLLTRRFTGTTWTLGAIYDLAEVLKIGFHYQPSITLSEKRITSAGIRRFGGRHADLFVLVAPDKNDTTSFSTDLPMTLGAGVSWDMSPIRKFVADVASTKWSALNSSFEDVVSWSIGAELRWTDDYTRHALLRVPVRLGVRSEKHYTTAIGGGRPSATFFSLGTGVSLGKNAGRVDWAVEWGTRGDISSTGAEERVVRNVISVVGWETWFQRRVRR